MTPVVAELSLDPELELELDFESCAFDPIAKKHSKIIFGYNMIAVLIVPATPPENTSITSKTAAHQPAE